MWNYGNLAAGVRKQCWRFTYGDLRWSGQAERHKGSTAAQIQMPFLDVSHRINLYYTVTADAHSCYCNPFSSLCPPPPKQLHAKLSSYWLLAQVSIFRYLAGLQWAPWVCRRHVVHAYLVNGALKRLSDTVCNGGFSGFYAVQRFARLYKKLIEENCRKWWKVYLTAFISWITIDNNENNSDNIMGEK